ncbi:mechanosensitive ion channel family protein [Streptomyces abyssomicinicus]|uniref:mechanosensitive ion channel family protein n=1 Tax=Streptomyces abyssomicinicus TaxID=574929 RepID=UPI00124FE6DA|nr:hypothetical protein [Streptomyces abyssomicinicus]
MAARQLAVDLTAGLEDAWSRIATFVPRLAAFLVVLVLGWLVARTVARIADRVMRRLGSERLAERAGVDRMLGDASHDTTGIVSRIVFYALMLVALQLALGVFGANQVSTMINGLVAWLPRGIVAVLLVVVALAIANGVRSVAGSALGRAPYGKAVATGLWAVVVVLGVIAALGQAGIATGVVHPLLYAALATVSGIAVVGVGGGLIGPMRSRWERWLTRAEQEAAAARGGIAAYRAGREDTRAGRRPRPHDDAPATGDG